ncbi:hypothetical protein [Gimesia sp.]|uniref:hypothetical protein n=1 Tax=Gimesia sp. TaxID=2024833 RepID=UPI003A907442
MDSQENNNEVVIEWSKSITGDELPVGDLIQIEGDTDTATLTFSVTLDQPVGEDVIFNHATVNNSADGTDFYD